MLIMGVIKPPQESEYNQKAGMIIEKMQIRLKAIQTLL